MQCELNLGRGKIIIQGFRNRVTDYIIDGRICDVNQASYLTRKPTSIVKFTENEKKKKYLEPYLKPRRHFTPFVVSSEGLLGKEANV